MDTEHEMTKGFAVVARSHTGGDHLRGFHTTKKDAICALRRSIDTRLLRIAKAQVAYADNGNVRRWGFLPA